MTIISENNLIFLCQDYRLNHYEQFDSLYIDEGYLETSRTFLHTVTVADTHIHRVMSTKYYVLISIFAILLLSTTCFSRLHVDIANRLPQNAAPLQLHCRSKDDDMGYHNLSVNQIYSWKFRMNFWGSTLFYCDFWWGEKHAAFKVFDIDIQVEVKDNVNVFAYEARSDGFYFYYTEYLTQMSYWQLVKTWDN